MIRTLELRRVSPWCRRGVQFARSLPGDLEAAQERQRKEDITRFRNSRKQEVTEGFQTSGKGQETRRHRKGEIFKEKNFTEAVSYGELLFFGHVPKTEELNCGM